MDASKAVSIAYGRCKLPKGFGKKTLGKDDEALDDELEWLGTNKAFVYDTVKEAAKILKGGEAIRADWI